MGLMTIRLTQEESENLTILRATYELRTLQRTSIKDCLYSIIGDAYERQNSEVLNLPAIRTVPAIGRGAPFEQISLPVSSIQKEMLNTLSVVTEYRPPDVIRELIKIYHASLRPRPKRRKVSGGKLS